MYSILTLVFVFNHIDFLFLLTFFTVIISISLYTSPLTVSRLFVTWSVVQTVATTVVDTVVSIGPVITLCNNS